MTRLRPLPAVAGAALLCSGVLAAGAPPAAAVFPAGENGDALYVLRGEVWRGNFADSGRFLERRLTFSGGTASAPRWNPEGTRIAFQVGNGTVRVMNADGTGKRTVVASGATDPAWSPPVQAVRRLAFVRAAAGGRSDVYSVRLDGSGLQRMTTDGATHCGVAAPDWSPDGRWLTYLRMEQGADATCGTGDDQKVVVRRNLDRGLVWKMSLPGYPEGPKTRPQVNSAGTMISWLAGSTCSDALAVYNLSTWTLSSAGTFEHCERGARTREYPPTPASAQTAEVYTTNDGQGCLRLGDRTFCQPVEQGIRMQLDVQPLHS